MKSLLSGKSAALNVVIVSFFFALGISVGLHWSGVNGGREIGNIAEPTARAGQHDLGSSAIPLKEKQQLEPLEERDSRTPDEFQLTEADLQSVEASSFGSQAFQPGTFELDYGFLESIGLTPGNIDTVTAIYGDSVQKIVKAEAEGSSIMPALDGMPAVLKIRSDRDLAKQIIDEMQKELVAEIGLLRGKLLSNSLSNSSLLRSSLKGGEREIFIESLRKTKADGGVKIEQIWESYTSDSGTRYRSTISIDYLEQRYGDAGVRLIEMAEE